jgi:hypothetical protein
LWAAVAAGTILSLVVSWSIAAGTFVLGSSSGGWVHNYLYPFQFRSIAIFAVVFACCAVLAIVPLTEVRRREWRIVAMWFALGLCAQGVLRGLSPYTMDGLFLGDGSNGFYQPTLQYGSVELLRDFDRIRPMLPMHPSTNMPGKVILMYALELVSQRPLVLAWLVVVVSNLGGLFLYLFVRDWLDDRETALAAAILYLFVPSKLLFFPGLNAVTPVFVLACAWLWVLLLESRRVIYGLALGAVAYGAVFYEPTPSVMGLLFLFLTAYAWWLGEIDLWAVVKLSVIVTAGFLVTYGAFLVLFQFDLLETLRRVAADAVIFNARVRRHYYPWIAQNLLDLAFGAGLCQTVLFCAVALMAVSRKTLAAGNTDGRMAALCLGTAIALLATDLAGINRGEVVRLWIFLACFLQVPAAYICRRLDSRAALILVLGTTILQTALSASMLAFLQP